MRFPRLKADSQQEIAYYHLINRIVGGLWLLENVEKEVLRKQIWATAAYCGLTVMTYALMSNHYHVLIKVPQRREVPDAELLRRYRAFHLRLNRQQEQKLQEVEKDMAVNGPVAQKWRAQQLRQMFDISKFGALLDQRFSIWYNRTHSRKGTLWMGRFKSVLVEDGDALRNIALYIDLNPCRAGIVCDPKDYRFCGYAEAVAGMSLAREGLQEVFQMEWSRTAERYRAYLLVLMQNTTAIQEESDRKKSKLDKRHELLSVKTQLTCRIRYFVDGVVLGSAAYVRMKAALLPGERKRPPRSLNSCGLSDGLHIMGRLVRSQTILT